MALTLVACEQMDEPTRELNPIRLGRTCLLIDFSGVRCPNCPDAAQIADELLEECGDNLIVVEMHPPSNPLTNAPAFDYRCDEADVWYKRFGCDGSTPLPGGAINLGIMPDGSLYGRTSWRGVLASAFADTTYRTLIPADTILWVVEDSIIGGQMVGTTTVLDYCHNHVLRGRIASLADTATIAPKGTGDHRYVVAVTVDADGTYISARKIEIEHTSK